jgi:hypothetical protein
VGARTPPGTDARGQNVNNGVQDLMAEGLKTVNRFE